MTFQINKSEVDALPFDFAEAVEAHRLALIEHRQTGNATPTHDPRVEAAVRRVIVPLEEGRPDDFVADFEIVDDTPPPPTSSEQRAKLLRNIQVEHAAAAARVISPARARLLSMDVSRVYAKPAESRTPADDAIFAQHAAIQARLNALTYHTATLEVEIEELADDQLDSWQMTAFPAV
ncbi:hypothetical protein AB8A05_10960 [Tardiphaga sp. 538_B7_N1_4]|uniref:hypothetical protein n=1 Tax=Tardiphaga sp. 538_B7_N1_4 TaxID=3240778 RepID=UPI003F1F119B